MTPEVYLRKIKELIARWELSFAKNESTRTVLKNAAADLALTFGIESADDELNECRVNRLLEMINIELPAENWLRKELKERFKEDRATSIRECKSLRDAHQHVNRIAASRKIE